MPEKAAGWENRRRRSQFSTFTNYNGPVTAEEQSIPSPVEIHSATNVPRYALYFSPPEGSPLARLGEEWLGRGPAMNARSIPDLPHSISSLEWSSVTEAAAFYGFHATLKPPFRLVEGASLSGLQQALLTFAANKSSFAAPHLLLGTLGHFLALILSEPSKSFADFAADCVREFDLFRAPAAETEIKKRMHDSLSPREQEHLFRWGYPYVLDTWKFHMTLTCSLQEDALQVFRAHLSERFAEACVPPLQVDSICLFEQPAAGAPFRLLNRFRLGA
jgi:putative phosphonate metabolism protein